MLAGCPEDIPSRSQQSVFSLQILTELEYSGVGRNKEQAARMLGHLVSTAHRLIRPYMEPILKVGHLFVISFTSCHLIRCHINIVSQCITFEKARRAMNRSLKMMIWSLGSGLCYEEKISARGRHYNTIRQGAPFYHRLSGRRHFNTTTRAI